MLRLSNSDLKKQETKSHTSVCTWREPQTEAWHDNESGRGNILYKADGIFFLSSSCPAHLPLNSSLSSLLRTHRCLWNSPVPSLSIPQSWSTVGFLQVHKSAHVTFLSYSWRPPTPAIGPPSRQQHQVPEGTGEQEGPLAMLWESRVPSPSQRDSLFKLGPAWLDPTFWEGNIRAGILDCNPRHTGPPCRGGTERPLWRAYCKAELEPWDRMVVPHPGKVIPARRNDNSQSPEMAANPQRPEKRKNYEARMGWVQGTS